MTAEAASSAGSVTLPRRGAVGNAAREEVLVLTRDPAVADAAAAAVHRHQGDAPTVVRSGAEALARLVRPGLGPHHLLADPAAADASWPYLLATLAEPGARTSLLVVSSSPGALSQELGALPAEPDRLMEAMRLGKPSPGRADASATELAAGLTRGEIVVRYQPVVRLSDRQPVMVEALARWERKPMTVPPDHFVPLAERAGLARTLSMVVAKRAAAEIGALGGVRAMGVSVNLPLAQLLQPDLACWLDRARARSGLGRSRLALELTETTEVQDVSALHRTLRRLRTAGYGVLLDDIVLDDPRKRFFHLPFLGFKLDRSLVTLLPRDARARQQVRELVRQAGRRGQALVAEGVADARLWALVQDLGVRYAQGFGIGRPLPAEALAAWSASWRSSRRS